MHLFSHNFSFFTCLCLSILLNVSNSVSHVSLYLVHSISLGSLSLSLSLSLSSCLSFMLFISMSVYLYSYYLHHVFSTDSSSLLSLFALIFVLFFSPSLCSLSWFLLPITLQFISRDEPYPMTFAILRGACNLRECRITGLSCIKTYQRSSSGILLLPTVFTSEIPKYHKMLAVLINHLVEAVKFALRHCITATNTHIDSHSVMP